MLQNIIPDNCNKAKVFDGIINDSLITIDQDGMVRPVCNDIISSQNNAFVFENSYCMIKFYFLKCK